MTLPASRLRRAGAAIAIAALLACTSAVDGATPNDGSESTAAETGSDGASATLSGTGAMSTSAGMSGSDATSSPSDGSTSTPPAMTTDADAGVTMGVDSSGVPDTSGSSTADPSAGTTTGGDPITYPACDALGAAPCPTDYDQCAQPLQGLYNFCTVSCENPEDCPAATSGSPAILCAPQMQICALGCGNGTCPDGMECITVGQVQQVMICAWPAS